MFFETKIIFAIILLPLCESRNPKFTQKPSFGNGYHSLLSPVRNLISPTTSSAVVPTTDNKIDISEVTTTTEHTTIKSRHFDLNSFLAHSAVHFVAENKINVNESLVKKAEAVVEEMGTVGEMVPEIAVSDEIADVTLSVAEEGISIYEWIEKNVDNTL
jgi:hypothetical protein